ncbi:MAG TPA: clostripain-related cysteine peptidase [Pyrinomonadaceae bacterium]|nr:clostripain-related cysteine peptidase [Pyrinomonadaceae bacterium]
MINTEKKNWTLMFFLASDNTLSPSTLSQLKAIKAAGSQLNANVLVYFDPNEKGAPTRVFEINKEDKKQGISNIGNPDGPLVSVLTRDSLSPEYISNLPGPLSKQFGASLQNVDALQAYEALENFLGFCRESYSADNYMLFLLGHGLVVGRDAFLPDDNPDSAIGLKTLGNILRTFSTEVGQQGQTLQLVGMHSCSMSSVEVAYELKGTAKYMLAAQGISFVGSWPYRQMLVKIYNAIEHADDVNVPELVKSLHSLCIQYSADFMYAGYSADMCLCSLEPARIERLTEPISKLAQALIEGLENPRCKEVILLAHWKSQSYWQETYTDLYDFCLCLRRLCAHPERQHVPEQANPMQFKRREYDRKRIAIIDGCNAVIEKLKPQNGGPLEGPVVCTDFIGPDCQYSHGLSIYFPWAQPLEDENDRVLENYQDYAFTGGLTNGPWLTFLESYFVATQREDRLSEERRYADEDTAYQNDPGYQRALNIARETFADAVATDRHEFTPTSVLEGKVSPPDAGGACACASTKNYSRAFSMSRGVATVFEGGKSKPAKAA